MQLNKLANADFDKMIIESIDEVYCFDKQTDELLFFFDQVKDGEITSESDTVYAEGRQGVQLAAFDRNKTAGFSCENGYVQAGALAVQLGSDLVSGETEFEVMETIKADASNKLVLTNVIATDDDDALIAKAYTINGDGSKKELVSGATLANAYDADTIADATAVTTSAESDLTVGTIISNNSKYYKVKTAITSGTTWANMADSIEELDKHGEITIANSSGTEYLVCYTSKSAAGKKIVNAGDRFSENIKLVINFVAQEPCGGNKYLMQCVMPNAKATGSFSLSAGDNPAVHSFEATALLDVCSTSKELFTIAMV